MTDDITSVESYLEQYAKMDRFWILRTHNIQPGLIHYLASDGVPFVLMDDDDDRLEKAINLLESSGCPIFGDVIAMDEYASELAKKSSIGK